MTSRAALPLSNILPAGVSIPADFAIKDLVLDSRQINTGDVFVCLNGEEYIEAAFNLGAECILVDSRAVAQIIATLDKSLRPRIIGVPNLRQQLPQLAKSRYFTPDIKVPKLIGVTGTNGKSSVVSFIAQIYAFAGIKSATIGTLGVGIQGESIIETGLTTPDILTNYRFIAECAERGVAIIAMEVSSHGLSQGRVDGLEFDCAIFTNLTQDHLDYHGSLSAYGDAKAKLFTAPNLRLAILNRDDAFFDNLSTVQKAKRFLSYSVNRASDIQASNIETYTQGLRFDLSTPWGQAKVTASILGHFNIYNIVAAASVALNDGIAIDTVVKAIAQFNGVNGRMQLVHRGDVQVVVDFAHTPDGLEQALKAVRHHTIGRLLVVFGCGGNRDVQKRALMGAIAEDLADQVIITSDNPRDEDPKKILRDVAAGCKQYPQVIEDRAEAIEYAVGIAAAGDSILIAGKGHENYQLIKGIKRPFSDHDVAISALANRNFTSVRGEAS